MLLRRGRHHPGGRPDRRHLRPYRARSRKKPTRDRTRSTPRGRWIGPWIHVIDPPVRVYSVHNSRGWPGRHGNHGGGNPQRELDSELKPTHTPSQTPAIVDDRRFVISTLIFQPQVAQCLTTSPHRTLA